MPIQLGHINYLRSSPQWGDAYLVVQQPIHKEGAAWAGYLWSGRVTIAPGALDPIYSLAVTSNNATTLRDGMTVIIGSAEYGGRDRGVVRLHGDQTIGAGAENLYIAVSSHLRTVQIGDYVTVLDEFRLWARFPYVTETGGAITFYKDYGYWRDSYGALGLTWAQLGGGDDDLAAEASMPPVPVIPPAAVRFIDPGGSADVYFDFADSYAMAPGNAITAWASEGIDGPGSTWSDNVVIPGYKTYSNISGLAGYRATLEVSDGSLCPVEFRRSVQYVFTLRRPGQTQPGDPVNAEPIVDFELTNCDGDFDTAYWTASIRVWGANASENVFQPGALVVLFADDYYGAEGEYLTEAGVDGCIGPIFDRENTVLVGRIGEGSVRENSETGEVTFQVISIAQQASERENYPAPIEDATTATDWYMTPGLTVGSAAWWFLVWHTTLPLITAVYQTGLTQPLRAHEFVMGDLLQSSVSSFLTERRLSHVLFDRYARLMLEPDADLGAVGAAPILFTLAASDWIAEATYLEIVDPPVSFIDGGGVGYDAATGTATPYLCAAPGVFSNYHGRPDTSTSLAVGSQADLNGIVGHALASRNVAQTNLTLAMAGNWRVGDLWPQERILVSLTTQRHTFVRESFFLRGCRYSYNRDGGFWLTEYLLRKETHGPDAVTVPIEPTIPIVIDPDDYTIPEVPPVPGTFDTGRRILGTEKGVFYCEDIDDDPPTWIALNTGLDPTDLVCWHLSKDVHHWYGGIQSACNLWGIFGRGTDQNHQLCKMTGFPGTWDVVVDVWDLRWGGAATQRLGAFTISPAQKDLIYAAYGQIVGLGINWHCMRSHDGGANFWEQGPIDAGTFQYGNYPGTWCSMASAHGSTDMLYFLSDRFVGIPYFYRTLNHGITWYKIGEGSNPAQRGANRLKVLQGSGDQSMVFTELFISGGITPQTSIDGGVTWVNRSTDISDVINEFSCFSLTNWAVLANTGKVYTTTNAGATWTYWGFTQAPATGALFTWSAAGVLTHVLSLGAGGLILFVAGGGSRDVTGNLLADFGVTNVAKIIRDGNIQFNQEQ